ncbi:MAG: Apolipoprotein N-acyltransferase [bacterium ADurb.Bin429]|nr:MAG: Apolipoprotein N-acyltransferase [bacterium ADurb.Bin429]
MKVLGMPLGLATEEPLTWERFLRGALWNIILVVAAGWLATLLFPPREVWWFGWLYLVPLFIALRRTREVRAAGWLTLLFGLAFFAAALPWISRIFGIAAVGIYLLMALPLVLFGLGYRLLAGGGRWWVTVLLAPALWVAVDWLRCEGWYFQFSWCQLGFGFASARHSGVLYPLTGVYGATFLLVLGNALVTELLTARLSRRARLLATLALAIPVAALCLYLNVPAPMPRMGGEPIRVAFVQGEHGDFDYFRRQTLALRGVRPALVVWPEYAIASYVMEDTRMLGELRDLARTMRATLVVGAKEHVPANHPCDWLRRRSMALVDGGVFANSAVIFGPDGAVIGRYHKRHPIQFFADGVPGRLPHVIPTPIGNLGVGICYDFDYAGTAVRMVHDGAELLVVPTFDAYSWSDNQHVQHARMAQARAEEAGRWVVRPTSSGVSQVFAPSGHAVATIPNGEEAGALARVSLVTGLTPYMRWFYALPYLCLAIAGLWWLARLRDGVRAWRKRRAARRGAPAS